MRKEGNEKRREKGREGRNEGWKEGVKEARRKGEWEKRTKGKEKEGDVVVYAEKEEETVLPKKLGCIVKRTGDSF